MFKVILHNSMEEKFMYRQVAVLYYTGHIVYAIAIHTKVEKTSSIKFHSH